MQKSSTSYIRIKFPSYSSTSTSLLVANVSSLLQLICLPVLTRLGEIDCSSLSFNWIGPKSSLDSSSTLHLTCEHFVTTPNLIPTMQRYDDVLGNIDVHHTATGLRLHASIEASFSGMSRDWSRSQTHAPDSPQAMNECNRAWTTRANSWTLTIELRQTAAFDSPDYHLMLEQLEPALGSAEV